MRLKTIFEKAELCAFNRNYVKINTLLLQLSRNAANLRETNLSVHREMLKRDSKRDCEFR